MSELVEVKVLIPTNRLSSFYAAYASWIEGTEGAQVVPGWRGPGGRRHWDGSEQDLAGWLWPKLSPKARRVLGFLSARPGLRLPWKEVADEVDARTNRELAGVLAWAGRYCNQQGYFAPVRWAEGQGYWMEPEVAQLFRTVSTNGS